MTVSKYRMLITVILLAFVFFTDSPGVTLAQGVPIIAPGVPITDNLPQSNSVKWYLLTLTEDGYISIDFEHAVFNDNSQGWQITLLDNNENTRMQFSSRWNEDKVSSVNFGLAAGKYYVRVHRAGGYAYNNTDYTLTVNHTVADNWEKEPNDSTLNATLMTVNKTYMGNLYSSSDRDVYLFEVLGDGYISIDFEHEVFNDNSLGWQITLFDYNGNARMEFSSRWNQNKVASVNFGLAAGKYYVRVHRASGYAHNDTDYTLTVNHTVADNWEKEPNGSTLNATLMTVNKTYMGNLYSSSDIDYYLFDLTKGGTINIVFAHEVFDSANNGWRITIFDHDNKTLNAFSSKWNEASVSSGNIMLDKGQYYIRINRASGYAHNDVDYTLRVNAPHIETPEPPDGKLGDINKDGSINIIDATLAMQHAIGLITLNSEQQKLADVNKDGRIDVVDCTLIMRKALGLIEHFDN